MVVTDILIDYNNAGCYGYPYWLWQWKCLRTIFHYNNDGGYGYPYRLK